MIRSAITQSFAINFIHVQCIVNSTKVVLFMIQLPVRETLFNLELCTHRMCLPDDMHPSGLDRLDQQAQLLVQRLATGCQNGDLGSATVSVYDTAWLSMLHS